MRCFTMLAALLIAAASTLAQADSSNAGNRKDNESVELLSGDVFGNFRPMERNKWLRVTEVKAVPDQNAIESKGEGEGTILVNWTPKSKRAPYLFTADEFGDVEVRVEFMVPKGSNSGVYLMGRYEIQILDSFGVEKPTHGDLGGLYQRWDTSRGKGKAGYEGVLPRVNAAKAPGEWQTIDIVFRAPRFDDDGKKTENARFIKVQVNSRTVHEDQPVTGPTRAHPLASEAATGPIAIQGDHGPIAIRSFTVREIEIDE